MSIATDVSRIKGNITAALAAIADKGVNVPDGSTSDALASLIASIEAGGGGGLNIPSDITNFAVDTLTLSGGSGVTSAKAYHSLGVVPTAAILINSTPRYIKSSGKSYIDLMVSFGAGQTYVSYDSSAVFNGLMTYANLTAGSTYKRNSQLDHTENYVEFSPPGRLYGTSYLVITMRWEDYA